MTKTPDPIAHAARLLREAAQELKQAHTIGGIAEWDGTEPEVQAVYDEHMAAAAAIEEWERAVGAGGVEPLRKRDSAIDQQVLAALKHARAVLNHHNLPLQCGPVNDAIIALKAAQPSRECLQQSDLHAAIMNLPCEASASHFLMKAERNAYRQGHKEARHAAAELAAALQAAPPAERCQCCGYLVTQSEHKGCIRAAARAQEHATQLAGGGHTPERQRMTAGRASFFMERFLKEEKLLGPNEQAALHFVIDMLAAPVQAQEDAVDPSPVWLQVDAGVRYWEDAKVNGVDDERGDLIPLRTGERWTPMIRLSDGFILGWPHGTRADVHYKVCDDGEYFLLDAAHKRVAKYESDYVPDLLAVGDDGYGDYIILTVSENGCIVGWTAASIDAEQWPAIDAARAAQGDRNA